MSGKLNVLFYVLVGSLVGSLVTIGITLGAGTANADCVSATGTAVVDCDGMLYGDLSGSSNGAVIGHGGQVDGQGAEDYDGTQGDFTSTDVCGAMAGSVPRC